MATSQEVESMIRITEAHLEGLAAVGATDLVEAERVRLEDLYHERTHHRLTMTMVNQDTTAASE